MRHHLVCYNFINIWIKKKKKIFRDEEYAKELTRKVTLVAGAYFFNHKDGSGSSEIQVNFYQT
jgi:hypothetical protein